MESNKYEPIKFDSWQELAKYVIDGGEVYWYKFDDYHRICVSESGFNIVLTVNNLFIKKQHTLEELIAIKPRLCWVWDCHDDPKRTLALINSFRNGRYYSGDSPFAWWFYAKMLTDDEIKQFLSGGNNEKTKRSRV